jgi:hypothetical protein
LSGKKNKLCCIINRIPAPVRFGLGLFCWAIGLPVFILPIPLGLILIMTGTILILGTSETAKKRFAEQTRRYPLLCRLFRGFVEQCPNCSTGDFEKLKPRAKLPKRKA